MRVRHISTVGYHVCGVAVDTGFIDCIEWGLSDNTDDGGIAGWGIPLNVSFLQIDGCPSPAFACGILLADRSIVCWCVFVLAWCQTCTYADSLTLLLSLPCRGSPLLNWVKPPAANPAGWRFLRVSTDFYNEPTVAGLREDGTGMLAEFAPSENKEGKE